MPATDLVPCFYKGQNFRWEQPVEFRTRAELHRIKKLKVGRFDQNGKIFLFRQAVGNTAKRPLDSPATARTILCFMKAHQDGAKLHYDVGPKGLKRHGLYHRRDEYGAMQIHSHMIRVSSRSLFNTQILPVRAIA
jgi:hypothetical protein